MSNLINQNWIGFDGKPVTGRVPPSMRLMAGQMTPTVMAEVAHRYQLFCMGKQTAAGDYFVSDRTLPDGSRVRIVSNCGVDVVMVWSSVVGDNSKLPHGFVVVISGSSPVLYKRTKGPLGIRWVKGGAAPQIKGDEAAYSQVLRPSLSGIAAEDRLIPIVYSHGWSAVSDYWIHAGPAGDVGKALPFIIDRGEGGADPLKIHETHFAKDATVVGRSGVVLYTHKPAPSALGGGADPVSPLPPSVDGEGRLLHLSSIRMGMLAASVNLYILSPRTEVLKCVVAGDEAIYQLVKNIGSVFTMKPISSDAVVTQYETLDNLEQDPPDSLSVIKIGGVSGKPAPARWSGTMWSIGYVGEGGGEVVTSSLQGAAWYNIGLTSINVSGANIVTRRAFTQKRDSSVVESRVKLIGLGDESGTFEMEYVSRLDYPDRMYWRGGTSLRSLDVSNPNIPGFDYFTVNALRIGRANSERSTIGEPKVFLTSWDDENLAIFFGNVNSKMSGHYYWDSYTAEYRSTTFIPQSAELISSADYQPTFVPSGTPPIGGWPQGTVIERNVAGYASAQAADLRPALQQLWDQSAADKLQREEWLPINQTVNYTLTCRHILDYDHRGKFWAAVELTVDCNGYKAQHPGGDYAKHVCVVSSNPTYDLVFSFVAAWFDADSGEAKRVKRVLRKFDGIEKPLFEAPITPMVDPYNWPSGLGPETTVEYASMTTIAPPAEVMVMMSNVATGQGLNPHFVGINHHHADRVDLVSNRGVEYSYLEGGREIPHTKRASGMLYARDISMADIGKLGWLLTSTTCDAPRNNNWLAEDAKAWHYMPQVEAFLNSDEKWHIEMRDGALVDWSDEFDGAPANKMSRGIRLYQT